jgi:hypothetical protein
LQEFKRDWELYREAPKKKKKERGYEKRIK